jgi:hypothetical protein
MYTFDALGSFVDNQIISLIDTAKVIFGTQRAQGEGITQLANNLHAHRLDLLLAFKPNLVEAFQDNGTLACINTFAGLRGSAGENTLLALHNHGINVVDGLNLAVRYNSHSFGAADTIRRYLATGVIDQITIDAALQNARKAGLSDNSEVLLHASTAPLP